MSNPKMQFIAPQSLNHVWTRVSYLQTFLGFDPSYDRPLIASTKPVLAPLLPTILDAVYTHLLTYDIIAKSFAPAQAPGQPSVNVHDLHLNHENIKHRQNFLKSYLVRLISNQDWIPESKFWDYLDKVGRMHTGSHEDPGFAHRKNSTPLRVEYMHMALLLGWVQDQVSAIVMGVESLEVEKKVEIVRALGKFWWIQNDLFARHYCENRETGENVTRDTAWQKTYLNAGAMAVAGIVVGVIVALAVFT